MKNDFWKNLRIGGQELDGNVALAPLAGTSDVTFRTLCHEKGASLVCTELVSARGIRYDHSLRRCYRFLEIDPENEGPAAIQLFGYEAEDFAEAVPVVLEHPVLRRASLIDINMGCPVEKVVKTGAGSALMTDLPRAASVLTACVRAAEPYGVPVTVKFRKGWDDGRVNAVEFARMCRDYGASAVTIHGRTREQMYHGKADWTCIAEVASALSGSGIPVFGNGDVKSGEDAARMLGETGVDGVMIGRAAQGNPWIFAKVRAFLRGEEPPEDPTPDERADMIRRHLAGLCARIGEPVAVREMRAQLACYFRGQRHGTAFKTRAMEAATYAEVDRLLTEWTEAALSGSDADSGSATGGTLANADHDPNDSDFLPNSAEQE